MISPEKIKRDFPILTRAVNGRNWAYLDNASTTQKPACVIKAVSDFYSRTNANIHRGVYTLSEEATAAYEGTRAAVAKFINAREPAEIIFTRNATESINLVALSWGEQNVKAGDNIVVSALEHHSNLLPWRQLAARKKAELRTIPINADGTLKLENLKKLIGKKTRLVAVTQMSNVLGTIVPVEKIIAAAKKAGAVTLVDGAQSVPHMPVDVRKLGCDFLAFSSHKMLGPTGVGVLYGRRALLEKMPPVLFGGDMVKIVSGKNLTWNDLPWKFEAGTPNIADVAAFKAALEYLQKIGMEDILSHDRALAEYAQNKLAGLKGLTIYGPKRVEQKGGIVSFNIPGVHPHDVASVLNDDGIAIRAGHHCCQPLMDHLGINATARMSFYVYTTGEDIDRAVESLKKVYKIFKK